MGGNLNSLNRVMLASHLNGPGIFMSFDVICMSTVTDYRTQASASGVSVSVSVSLHVRNRYFNIFSMECQHTTSHVFCEGVSEIINNNHGTSSLSTNG